MARSTSAKPKLPKTAAAPQASKKRSLTVEAAEDEEVAPLSPSQIRELNRRIEDSNDPTRYMLAAEYSHRFILYYNVSDDVYAMNDPTGGTLFKRLKTAKSVKKHLGKNISIVKYTTKGGKLKRLSPFTAIWPRNKRKGKKGSLER